MLKKTFKFHGRKTSVAHEKKLKLSISIMCAKILMAVLLTVSLSGCGLLSNRSGKSYVIKGKRYHILASSSGYRAKGLASWYGEPFHGRKTASGEVYDMHKISAAHKTLPLHTWVEVKNLDNNKMMVMRVNDRGPFVKGRIIDLSRAAAEEMGMLKAGVARVTVRAISKERARRLAAAEPPKKSQSTVAASAGK